MVVLGVGVLPRTALAKDAGITVDNGIVVNDTLCTSAPDIYAAGDVARYPDPISGENVRIEHWALAERQGQAVARTMLGIGHAFRDVPFFWSQHYDVQISYVGHSPGPGKAGGVEVRVAGSLAARDAAVVFRAAGQVRAVATVFRDRLSLEAELALERGDQAALAALTAAI